MIIDLCLHSQNGRFADDAMYCAASENTPMDCLLGLLGEITTSKGAPPPYESGGAGMGGLLAGLRDAAALNAAPPPHEPGGLLSMFREIRKLDIEWYKCDRTGEFVMLPRNR